MSKNTGIGDGLDVVARKREQHVKRIARKIGEMLFEVAELFPVGDARRGALVHLQNASHVLVTGERAYRVMRGPNRKPKPAAQMALIEGYEAQEGGGEA